MHVDKKIKYLMNKKSRNYIAISILSIIIVITVCAIINYTSMYPDDIMLVSEIYWIAICLILLIATFIYYKKTNSFFLTEEKRDNDYKKKIIEFDNEYKKHYTQLDCDYHEKLKQLECEKEKLLSSIKSSAPFNRVAKMYSDLISSVYDKDISFIGKLQYPVTAINAAARMKDMTLKIIEESKIKQYKYDFLIDLFPDLQDFIDSEELIKQNLAPTTITLSNNLPDHAIDWLTEKEYFGLNELKRDQLALDRYLISGKKTDWEIGRDYEIYIAYRYRQDKGYKVEQIGINKRKEDHGRDIIATKDNVVLIIQCKCWSNTTIVRENHIFQLYGAMIEYKITHNSNLIVKAVFITSTIVSNEAKLYAKELGVTIKENIKMGKYPSIKCNINNGNKLYHLPFDRLYDLTQIKKNGEKYVFTIEDAEKEGFKRAFKSAKISKSTSTVFGKRK